MHSRRNRLAAQKAQVALVFQEMLGTEEARAYLVENNFEEATIDRILHGDPSRRRAVPTGAGASVTLRDKAPASSGARPLLTVDSDVRARRSVA